MSLSIATMVKDGHTYMKTWPLKRELYSLFPECRVITATKFAMKVLPALGIFTIILLVNNHSMTYLPQALAMGGMFFIIPLQGQIWLGHRANQALPPSLHAWYVDIRHKMQEQGCTLPQTRKAPRYMELAALLKMAFDDLDNAFTERWF